MTMRKNVLAMGQADANRNGMPDGLESIFGDTDSVAVCRNRSARVCDGRQRINR